MAQYWEDWSGENVGAITVPVGWTRRWDTANASLSIIADAAAPAGKALRISKSVGDRFLLSFDEVDSDANRAMCEVLALIRFRSTSYVDGNNVFGCVGRASGTSTSETGYVGNIATGVDGTTTKLVKRIAPYSNATGVAPVLSEFLNAVATSVGQLAWVKLVCSGTTISVGYAPDVGGVPGTENLDSTTLTTTSSAGWVGLFSFSSGVSVDVLAVGVGTNGDAAPVEDPESSTVDVLTASDLVVSSPVLGTPTLDSASTVDALTASDLVVSSPDLGVPALSITATIRADYERSSVNLSGSSVSGSGSDATITIKPRVQESEAYSSQSRWLEPSARIDNVLGHRPTFKFTDYAATAAAGKYHGAPWESTRRPVFSYDREAWHYFDTCTVGTSDITFRHSAAFTSATVYIGRSRQISVAQNGEWLEGLATAHPTLFHPAPSAVAFTPTLTSWPAQDFIADEFSAQTNELGAAIPATPFYAAVIDDGAPGKAAAYISMGVHAGEDHADYVCMSAVERLLGSSAEAIELRSKYRIYIYPCVNAPGRAGGGMRGSFTQGTAGADDLNRHFSETTSGLEIVDKPKAAMLADRGSDVLAFGLDFHGAYSTSWGVYATNDAFATGYLSRINAKMPLVVTNMGENTADSLGAWYLSETGGTGTTLEFGDKSPVPDSDIETYTAALLDVLAEMSADGTIPVYNHELIATDLVIPAPALGSPSIGQAHVLTATSLVAGSPVLGTPTLAENAPGVDALTASDLVVGSPVLGRPAITQIHALTVPGLTVGVPVLGTPVLTSGAVAIITASEVARIVRASSRMKTVTAAQRAKQVRYEVARA